MYKGPSCDLHQLKADTIAAYKELHGDEAEQPESVYVAKVEDMDVELDMDAKREDMNVEVDTDAKRESPTEPILSNNVTA